MKKTMNSFVRAFFFMGMIVTTTAVFKEYCTPGLCKHAGGDGMHTGCRNGVLNDFKLQPNCKDASIIDVDEDLKKVILDFHNKHRNIVAGGGLLKNGINAACRIGAVTWDEELKFTAELHARECKFAHDKCRGTLNYPLAGQNLGVVTYDDKRQLEKNLTKKVTGIMVNFYDEYKDTKQSVIDHYARSPPGSPMIGHFLTMVNERNNRIGCSATNYRLKPGKMQFLISCNYATNSIPGSTIYNSCKEPGRKCTSGKHPEYPNICSVNEVYDYSLLLAYEPYDSEGQANAEYEGNVDGDNGYISGSITNDIWHYCLLLSCIVIYFLG